MRSLLLTLALAVALGALLFFVGCSQQQADISNFNRNLLAAACADPASTIANVPGGFITPAQATQALTGLCAATFGTVAAPTTAPGNIAALPAATAAPAPATTQAK